MPDLFKPSQYESKLLAEFERLWINKTSVLIISQGRDKYTLTDGNRGITGKGFVLLKVLKALPDKTGYSRLWSAFDGVAGIKKESSKKVIIEVP